jgi:hypothetical protein
MTLAGSDTGFTAWRNHRDVLDADCPWPGPRPLVVGDELVGRDQDKLRFRQEVDSHRLVLLAGDSGVGKSSLLEAGFIPELKASGYVVAVCRDWNWSSSREDPATFLAEKIRQSLVGQIDDLPDGAGLFWDLESRLGGRAVLVLDQFEELIRYSPALTELVFNLLLDINHETTLKVVLSFRSEFLHRLRALENQAKPFTISRYVLEEIDSEHALDVVLSGNRGGRAAIDAAAAKEIATAWQTARESTATDDTPDPYARVGLLHLQALLYALHAAESGRRIDAESLVRIGLLEHPAAAFVHGLRDSIDAKLDRCRAAAEMVGVDQFLIEGAQQQLARMVRHLSSAGYKLVREASELAEAALEKELDALRNGLRRAGEDIHGDGGDGEIDQEQLDALLDELMQTILEDGAQSNLDLLQSRREAIAGRADRAAALDAVTTWVERLHGSAENTGFDPVHVSCGPLSGAAPAHVVIEEFRRFVFALAWLKESSLVRLSTPGGGRVMVSLIHDGFGEALRRWAKGPLKGPIGALTALTALAGSVFDWAHIGTDRVNVYANLSWRGAWIRSSFSNVVFMNCDFRGSQFDQCEFTGVTFMNCLLDGVMFSDCSFDGPLDNATTDPRITQPIFIAADELELASAIARYRESGAEGSMLVSQLPGLPAIRVSEAPTGCTDWAPAPGGIVVYGGRISSFVVRSCEAIGDSGIAFRYVAGSGLDVVEDAAGRYELYGSSLRHVTFALDSSASGHELDIVAIGSVLVQMWIGEHVRGRARADDCRLVHLWNDSEIEFTISHSSFHGLVNAVVDEASEEMGDATSISTTKLLDPDDAFARSVRATDYQRDPSVVRI